MDNYPLGAEYDAMAPYNQSDNPPREIEVTLSVCYIKKVKVKTSDYKIEYDDDGGYYINYEDTDFYSIVEDQVPEIHRSGWELEDIEIINTDDTCCA